MKHLFAHSFVIISGSYSSRSNISNLRILDKKDTLHPPVSYRPISRTGAISRETSPSSVSSSTPGSYSSSRLYPESYTRSASRERTESTSPSSTIPKYTGRSNTTLTRTGRNESKEDLTSRYKTSNSRTTSREDLNSGQQKYITSRFLPKNTVEKSYTAYTRPSAVRVSEACRKNRELLNVIAAQHEQEKLSRPVSRCSSTTPEDTSKSASIEPATSSSVRGNERGEEMESVSVITSTSSMQKSPANVSRARKIEVAKTVEKAVTTPKQKAETTNKELQSDKLDDTNRYSKFASSSSKNAATPWSSYLDMKFSSPGDNQKTAKIGQNKEDISSQSDKTDSASKTHSNKNSKEGSASPRNMSRSNSVKNLSRSFSKLDMKGKESRSPTPTSQLNDKSKQKSVTSSKTSDKKQLPPQIPKSESNSKSNSVHSGSTPNKDFRKSVLNMNYDGKPKKITKRSSSVSSADSGSEAADTTDISENLTSCPSYHKSNSSSSKLPQRISAENTRRSCTRSPSLETNSSSSSPASGSEDDQSKKIKQKKRPTAFTPKDASDESEKAPKPPLSPRVKNDNQRSEVEAKSFLMRALAPVTSLFKVRHIDSNEKINWMDSSTENTPDSPEHSKQIVDDEKPQKKMIKRVESGEKAWWMEEEKQNLTPEEKIIQKTLRHVDSSEKPWWMDENAEVPSGVEQYTSGSPDENSDYVYKVRHNDSDNKEWWLSSSDNANDKSASENAIQPESLQQYRLRHIDSGERAWWFSSTENLAENTNQQGQTTQGDNKPIYKIRHQESGERAWWMNPQKNQNDSDDDSENELIPLGDRASPEGLETPRDEEIQGRRTPYDNVPGTQGKAKRPTHIPLFISRHTNIDDILGGTTQLLSPLMDTIFSYRQGLEEYEKIEPSQVKIHEGLEKKGVNEMGRK